MQSYTFRKIAVLGAGVMGAQIAAHCVNAGISTLLFDLADETSNNKNAFVEKAIQRLVKLKPSPLGNKELASSITACNYDEHCEKLADCDLVIEAIGERMDWKESLYKKVCPHLKVELYS